MGLESCRSEFISLPTTTFLSSGSPTPLLSHGLCLHKMRIMMAATPICSDKGHATGPQTLFLLSRPLPSIPSLGET